MKIRPMMIFCFILLAAAFAAEAKETRTLYPALDLTIPTPLPKNFRLLNQPFVLKSDKLPRREGLERLQASASGQFTSTSFLLMLNKLPPKKVLVIDLREESHGYINGFPVSWEFADSTWTNMNKSFKEIQEDEQRLLHRAFFHKVVTLDPEKRPLKLEVCNVATEKEVLSRLGIDYMRLPVTENHKPSDATVDQLVTLLNNLPNDKWLHIHCHGGKGRTTTVLLMYDILMNGRKITLDDILLRQRLIGGSDFYKVVDPKDPRYKPLKERLVFIQKFYEYVRNADTAKMPWSLWIKQQQSKSNA